MKYYKVEKNETFTVNGKEYFAPVANYGIMCEKDVALTVRGYKANKMDEETIIYNRKNSKYFFVATVA